MAATAGALWLAYVSRHEDSDHLQGCFAFEGSSICRDTLVADRSTNELVVVRVPTDVAMAPTVVWRTPITERPAFQAVAMDARGTHLVLAVQSSGPRATPNIVRYVMLDVSGL
jgi:hypothetical protein